MLGHPEFRALTLPEQTAYISQQGNYLAVHQEDGCLIILYHLNTFFAEAWTDSRNNQLRKITSFTSVSCLEPYIENIKLSL